MASSSVGMSYTLAGFALTLALGAVARAQPAPEDGDHALATLLDTYAKRPDPKILLDIASALRELGRLAEAANMYQHYLLEPAPVHSGEVKELLQSLDARLTILTVHVVPRGADLSIDAHPYVSVGSTLHMRVRPGPHLIRIRRGTVVRELDLHGFEGEVKDVTATLPDQLPDPAPPEHVEAWLVDRPAVPSAILVPSTPRVEPPPIDDVIDDASDVAQAPEHITSGVEALVRVDGKGRGFAGGLGIAYSATDTVELQLAALKSDIWGAYAGVRYRFLTGWIRPYAALGMPMFFFSDDAGTTTGAFGVRAAAGVELVLTNHLSVEGDLGIEHFFNVGGTLYMGEQFDETIFVPTLGVMGRL